MNRYSEVKYPRRLVPKLVPIFAKLALLLVATLIGIIVLEIALRWNPRLMPSDVPTFPPVRRYTPKLEAQIDFKVSSGDLFVRMERRVRPLDEAQDYLLEQIHITTDSFGFRNNDPWLKSYAVVALGDSFTYGIAAPVPWPQRLQELSGKSVLNLGLEGIGPLEERDLYLQYGRTQLPEWVIVAFFEGNDLNDARSYAQANPFLVPRLAQYLRKGVTSALFPSPFTPQLKLPPAEYVYPLQLSLGGRTQNVTLFDFYLSWLSPRQPEIAASLNELATIDAFRTLQQQATQGGTHLLIVFVPSKERVYLPFITDGETLRHVFRGVPAIRLDHGGILAQSKTDADPNEVLANLNSQELEIGRIARELGSSFLDLTPCFEERTRQGEQLFYEYDTHWNQNGHDLAALMVFNYLKTGSLLCPSSTAN